MTYKPTGQKILFRGLDDPLKVTSITVEVGVLCWLWIEEAYEISSEADFDTLDESIRGEVPPGLFKQITLTFNPWNEHHWIKHRFFDAAPDPDILAMTTNYTCNEWLDSVLQDHTSQASWEPGAAPSLFAKVLIPDPDVIPEWEQPDSTNAYKKGDKVRFEGKVYKSLIDNNVWSPSAYPAGWQQIKEG